MNKMIQILLIYFVMVGIIFGFNYSLLKDDKKNLNTIYSQLSGIEYLETLHTLSILVANSMAEMSNHLGIKKSELKIAIDKIVELQDQNPKFRDDKFKDTLEHIYNDKMIEEDYYEFLSSVNHKNYTIGDTSRLLYVNDRELYLLGTLVTHYMPEFLISTVIRHNIVEKYKEKKDISTQEKIIFTQQSKLVHLSISEIEEIVSLLDRYQNAKHLQPYILKIVDEVSHATPSSKSAWVYDKAEVQNCLKVSHKVLETAYSLNGEIFQIIEELLVKRKNSLENEIFFTKLIVLFVLLVFSLLSFLYYRADRENFKKDIQIKNINETLDQLVIFCKMDKDGCIIYSSEALEKLTGYTNDELIGKTSRIFRHRKTDKLKYKDMWETVRLKNIYTGTMINRMKSGDFYWAEITMIPELDSKENIEAFSVYVVDVTQKKELVVANKKLEKLSQLDTLTQVFNRLKLDTLMESLYERYRRYDKIFSIMIIDIDYFKNVNDTYGHLVGDEVLVSVVECIKRSIRVTDVLGRWGGEEFMVICEETDAVGAYSLGEKIREEIQNHQFGSIDTLTVSVGVAEIKSDISIYDFIKRADDSLYRAKKSGRNKTVAYKEREKEKKV